MQLNDKVDRLYEKMPTDQKLKLIDSLIGKAVDPEATLKEIGYIQTVVKPDELARFCQGLSDIRDKHTKNAIDELTVIACKANLELIERQLDDIYEAAFRAVTLNNSEDFDADCKVLLFTSYKDMVKGLEQKYGDDAPVAFDLWLISEFDKIDKDRCKKTAEIICKLMDEKAAIRKIMDNVAAEKQSSDGGGD